MNWIIQSDYNEAQELTCREDLTEQEQYRLEELESNIDYYEKTYGGNY